MRAMRFSGRSVDCYSKVEGLRWGGEELTAIRNWLIVIWQERGICRWHAAMQPITHDDVAGSRASPVNPDK